MDPPLSKPPRPKNKMQMNKKKWDQKPSVLFFVKKKKHMQFLCLRVWARVKMGREDTDTTSFEFWHSISQVIIKQPLLVFSISPIPLCFLYFSIFIFIFLADSTFLSSSIFSTVPSVLKSAVLGNPLVLRSGMYQNCIFLACLLFRNSSFNDCVLFLFFINCVVQYF